MHLTVSPGLTVYKTKKFDFFQIIELHSIEI